MDLNYRVAFFIGKGGVGKTTCAASYALGLAERGRRVLLISLDPAHNLGDVLSTKLGDEPQEVLNNLYAAEVDFDAMISRYLSKLSEEVKDIYGHLRVLNIDRYVDILKNSPGIEEYATLDKITHIILQNSREGKYEVIVFDTPPTGLMIRVMSLPSITLLWINNLMKLREAILSRRRMIEKVTGEKLKTVISGKEFIAPSTPSEDPIYKELTKIKEEVTLISSVFKDPKITKVFLVMNPETLSIVEAKRSLDTLTRLGISVNYVVINKLVSATRGFKTNEFLKRRVEYEEKALKLIHDYFRDRKIVKIPYFQEEPKGYDALKLISEYFREAFTFDE